MSRAGGLLLTGALAGVLAVPVPAAAAPQGDLLERLRERLGSDALAGMPGGLRLAGSSDFLGEPGRFELLLAGDGRFRRSMAGPLPRTWAWDGTVVWERDWTGMPALLDLEDREQALLTHWGITGLWLVEGLPMERAVEEEDGAPVVHLRLPGGAGGARLYLGDGGLPATLELDTATGQVRWTFTAWREHKGVRFPGQLHFRSTSGQEYGLTVEEAATAPAWLRDPFAMPAAWPDDVRWDSDADLDLEVRHAATGHLLVRARLGDGEPRWFIFDTGAGSEVLDRELADDLGLQVLGSIPAQGVGGTVPARFRCGTPLRVGPLVWQEPTFVELDLQALAGIFGVELAGILGYGLLSRAAVEVDTETPAVRLYPPDTGELPEGGWQPMLLSGRHPVVRARFEGDREEWFKIDTGSTDHVLFHAPAVRRLALLEGRDTRIAMSGGVGGLVAARRGTLAWFEVAGRRFTDVPATFSLATRGALTNPWVAGTLGGGIMGRFRIVYDYRHRRIAFLPREE